MRTRTIMRLTTGVILTLAVTACNAEDDEAEPANQSTPAATAPGAATTAAAPGLDNAQRGRMITWSRPLMLLLIVLIMITGIRQTIDNPFLRVESWATLGELRERTYGLALFWKHGFVIWTFALTLIVKFVLAPRLLTRAAVAGGGTAAGGGQTERLVLWLSVLNLLAYLGVLVLATRMLWELH